MSGRVTRYLLRSLGRHGALTLVAFAAAAVAVDGLERAGLLLAHDAPPAAVASYLGLRLATVAHLLVPLAAAVGVALAVAGLRHDGEWDALRALGAGPAQLAAPFVLAALVLAAGLVWWEGWVLPRAIEGAARVESARVLGGTPRLGHGAGPRWWHLDGGVLVATEVAPSGDRMRGVTWLGTGPDGRTERRVDAAELVHTERGWVAADGIAWSFPTDGSLHRSAVDAEIVALEGLSPGGIRRRLLPLAQYDLPMLWDSADPEARFTRQARLAHPCSTALLLLLALVATARLRRGRARAAGVALALAGAATVLDLLAGALAPALGWPPWLPWLLPTVLAAAAVGAAYRTTKNDASSRNQRVAQSA